MNFEEAQNWFRQYANGNETIEQTYNRISANPNSRDWYAKNDEAISVIRRHRLGTTSVQIRPSLQRFVLGTTAAEDDAPTTPGRAEVQSSLEQLFLTPPVELDLSLSPEEKRTRGTVGPQGESKEDRKKRLQRERQQRYRARKTPAAKEKGRSDAAASMAQLRARQTAEEAAQRRSDAAASMAQLRARQTVEEGSQRRSAHATLMSQQRADETDEQRSQRQSSDAVYHSQHRANETDEQRSQRQSSDAVYHSQHRANETDEQRSQRQSTDAVYHSQYRANETDEQRSQRQSTDAAYQSQHRTAVASTTRTAAQIMAQSANISDNAVVPHSCGPMNVKCRYCGSYNFKDELPSDGKFTKCCQKGRLLIPKPVINGVPQDYPDFLRRLMSDPTHPYYRNFREHIRSYNSSVSFASFGAKLDRVPGNGPYCFKVHGQTYHLTSHTETRNNQERPAYAQLYVIDSATQAVQTRMQHPAMVDCMPAIVRQIHDFYLQYNSIARSYTLMHEIQQREAALAVAQNLQVPVVHMAMKTDRSTDERRFNLPTANEVAMIFVNEDGTPPFHRDIRIYPRNPNNADRSLFRLNIRNSNLDPMVYSILFPYGQPGWHPEYVNNGAHFSMLQHKSALMAIRDDFNPVLSAGKLSQQWIVDSYLQIEAHNLEYIRFNQTKLRAELYKGLADFVERRAAAAGGIAGRPVILPSSFEGSPRNMRERLQDAMSIFGKFGPPDLLITFTANPNWPEIQDNLRPGETASDRSDLVTKVFKIKLNALLNDIVKNGIFGRSVAHVYTIEFQKRGLPHAHILIVLTTDCKFRTREQIDAVVSAEIPDFATRPLLHEIVKKQMLHGPCGDRCRDDDGNCTKGFPKEYQPVTEVNAAGTGYPLYRRSSETSVFKNGTRYDNRHVVPYNPYLLLKYNAHINVEICTSMKAIKYIYKYIYKGFDCANCKVGYVDGQQVFTHDEISNFINARYVSAPESCWRIFCFRMHDRSHAVITLPVHLSEQQQIYFEEGREEEAVEAARDKVTKLTAWFKLNETDSTAQQHLYPNIPLHYVFQRNEWKKRERGHHSVIGRMYGVSPRDEERFSLRLLLLHVPGATSYEYLRTYNGVEYPTFKEAAMARRLLSSDEEFDKFLLEASNSHMPYQLRQAFAHYCVFCRPPNAKALFEKYEDHFILDLIITFTKPNAINVALHQMRLVFEQHGQTCVHFGLPEPTGDYREGLPYDQQAEKTKADDLIRTLTVEQRAAFDTIVDAIDRPGSHKYLYLNGPGGSGKTYLYKTLISFVRGRGQTVKAFASTGIASTLLDGATTIHSGFGVPVILDENKTSSIQADSPRALALKNASILILDEITMLNKEGLRIIDKLLQDIMRNNLPFGGKTIVISGDFRQTLPIVVHGNRVKIIEASITSGPLWQYFHNISLTQNMRSAGQNLHNTWLLNLGCGDTPRIPGLGENVVRIPTAMISTRDDILNNTFGPDIRTLTVDELSCRAILASTNAVTLAVNEQIIGKLDGDFVEYTSVDEIISDGNDAMDGMYPTEFLNAQTPSGVPPHKLRLKVGAVVMLMRNLNKQKGLCNGTRMIVRALREHFIVCEIISENQKGKTVFITRLNITPSQSTLPFQMKRRQFPLIPAFAMTINKSQGQSFELVSIILDVPVFGHGQLYVALSRCKDPRNIKISIEEGPRQGRLLGDHRWFTENVVYKEIFRTTIR